MKLPQTIFIKHCPNLSPECKTFLIKHLAERVPIKDIRWVEDYNHTDLFVRWINKRLSLPYGLKLTSNMVKSIMSWKIMIDENIESAIFMDDDVVFHKDWVNVFESIQIDEAYSIFKDWYLLSFGNQKSPNRKQLKAIMMLKYGNNNGNIFKGITWKNENTIDQMDDVTFLD